MKSMRKIFSLILCLILLLSCTQVLAEEEHGPLWIEGGEDVTLTYWTPISATCAQHYTTMAEHPYYIWLEEQTGVNVEFVHFSWEQQEQQFNLMVTSGNMYDLIYNVEYVDGPQASINDGIFVDLNLYKDLMPDYYAAVNCGDGSFAAWEWGNEKPLYNVKPVEPFINRTLTVEGNMWCCTQVWTDDYPVESGAVIRQDWLDEAGLKAPTTLDELEQVLAAFKARGEDVIPMTLGARGYSDVNGYINAAFGVIPHWWTVTGDTVDPHATTTPEFKEYLTLMNKWYELGYIDPDFMNRDFEGQEALFLSDRLGIMTETWTTPAQYEELYRGAQAFDVSALTPVTRYEGQTVEWQLHYDSCPTLYTSISTACEHPEIAAQWLNAQFTKEAILRATYGVEGESYVIDEETGAPYFTDWYFNNPDGLTVEDLREMYLFPNFTGYCSTRAWTLSGSGSADAMRNEVSEYQQTCNTWGANSNYDKVIGYVTFEGDGWGEMYDLYVEADTYAAPMIIKFIIGEESLDNFDAYAEMALQLGFEEARDLTQAAYSKMQH